MVNPVTEVGVPAAQRGPRPATVRTATILQGAVVALLLAIVALVWLARAQQDGYAEQAAQLVGGAPGELEAEYSSNLAEAVAITVMAGLPMLWFAATMWPMLRGSNAARILAAIGAFGIPGLGLFMVIGSCVTGLLFVGMFAAAPVDGPPIEVSGPDGGIDFPEDSPFQQKLWDLQSSGPGIGDLLPLIALAVLALLVAVAVLLVVPSTNRWFSPESALRRGRPYPVYYPVYIPQPMYAPPPPYVVPPAVATPPPAADPSGSTDMSQ